MSDEDTDDDIFVSVDDGQGPRRPPRHDRGRGQEEDGSADHEEIDDGDIFEVDDDYEDDLIDLPSAEKLPRWVLVLGVLVLVAGLLVGGASFWYDRQVNPPGSPHGSEIIEVHRRTSVSSMGDVLASRGVVTNSMLFNFWAGRKDLGRVEAGAYEFQRNMSFDDAATILQRGPSDGITRTGPSTKVLIPEGLTIAQMNERIAEKVDRFSVESLEAALDGSEVTSTLAADGQESLEGLLFPATYDVGAGETEVEVLQKLASEMEVRVAQLDPEASVARINEQYDLDIDVYDAIIVASMVQSEAASAEEAPIVASVIYNRLTGRNPSIPFLGIDAVDRYGAQLEGVDLRTYWEGEGPYNTRKVKGLPPTPISSPGPWALEAAFAPAETNYFYYVLVDVGVHSFNETKAGHDRDVATCRAKGLCGA